MKATSILANNQVANSILGPLDDGMGMVSLSRKS